MLTDWFLVSYKPIQGLASTVAFLGWGLVTKTAKKRTEWRGFMWLTTWVKFKKKKKNQRHPLLDIKGNSPTNLEKAKQTKSFHKKKKKKGELCSCTDLYHSSTGRGWGDSVVPRQQGGDLAVQQGHLENTCWTGHVTALLFLPSSISPYLYVNKEYKLFSAGRWFFSYFLYCF